MVDDLGWWTVPIVSLVIFTLYGIEGIGSQLEDPFGYDRNDIKMDAIVGDFKMEIDVALSEWRKLMAFVDAESSRSNANRDAEVVGGLEEKFQPDMFLRYRPVTARV
jgi:putative membrane protein